MGLVMKLAASPLYPMLDSGELALRLWSSLWKLLKEIIVKTKLCTDSHISAKKTEFQAVSSYLNKLYNIYNCKTPVRPATGNYRLGVCEKSVGNG